MKHNPALGRVYELDVEKIKELNAVNEYCQCENILKDIANDRSDLWFRFIFCPCCFNYWAFGPLIRSFSINASVFERATDEWISDILRIIFEKAMIFP